MFWRGQVLVGCARRKWNLRGFAGGAIVFEATVELAATESEDRVCAADGPAQVRSAECRIAHSLRFFFKVVGFDADPFEQLRIGKIDGAECCHEVFDLAFIQ